MQGFINFLMVDVCREEDVSPEKVFLLFCSLFIIMNCSRKNLGIEFFCVSRKQHIEISGVGLKRSGILSVACCVLLSKTKIEKWHFL